MEACGLPLGPVDRTRSAFNERGHFSNPAVDAVNAALLAPLRSEVLMTPQDDLAIQRILTVYEPPLAGIKSPELMYTAALWARHSAGARVVATIRHPSAVARSARRRLATEQGSAPSAEALLRRWHDYNTMLLALRARLVFPVVDFSAPFDRYVDQIRSASDALGLIFDPEGVLTFLSEDLRHEREEETLDPATSKLYDQLREHAAEPPVRADEVRPEQALEVFGPPRMPSPMDEGGTRLSDRWHLAQLRLAEAVREIQRLNTVMSDAVGTRDAEIYRLQSVLKDAVDTRDREIRRLQALLEGAKADA